MPKQIADKMRNINFRNFDEFRQTFWKLVADEPKLSKGFSTKDLIGMKNSGTAPVAPFEQWNKKQSSYVLHHSKPIHDGGEVYDLDNIVIVTPRYHKEILDPKYHKGNGKK